MKLTSPSPPFHRISVWMALVTNTLLGISKLIRVFVYVTTTLLPLNMNMNILYVSFTVLAVTSRKQTHHSWKHRKNCECCPGHYLIVNH